MRKLIVFASALAFVGGASYAMDEDSMDKDMGMEAPAPSVSIGGSATIGIQNKDDDNDATEDFLLVREYKVTFDSSGTTDGGLMFGAGISIEDTHDDDPGNAVNGAKVYVGGADGVWKLQFGGNDPGIDLAGGFGAADDKFGGEDDETIALSGSFGGTSYRISMADPGINVPALAAGYTKDDYDARKKAMDMNDDWSLGVSHSLSNINIGVGMDSEDGLALGAGTDFSGVNTFIYWSKAEFKDVDVNPAIVADSSDPTKEAESAIELATQEYSGIGVKASMAAGEGASFSVGYSTMKLEQSINNTADGANVGYNGTAKTKLIEVDFSYDLGGGATFNAGIDKKDEESIMVPVNVTEASTLSTKDTTTLEATVSMSF